MRGVRVALYYAPAADDPLSASGAAWLGTSAAKPPAIPNIDALTAEPRRYGFHATLKPPMKLQHGVTLNDVLQATSAIAASIPAFDLPPLAVANLHGFLALRETTPCPALQALADAAIAGADHLRAPPDEAELAKRRRAGLSPAQEANLLRWGYPYVFATWTFHMTLSRRLTSDEHAILRPAAETWFAPALQHQRQVSDICIFLQNSSDSAFALAERIPLAKKSK
jgi:hypothetical protein